MIRRCFLDVPDGTLMVAGHMHGGQVRLPFLHPPLVPHGRAPRRWSRGHIKERGGNLIVFGGPWLFRLAVALLLST